MVRLAGGLGNQLFQFSAAFHLASSKSSVTTSILLDDRFLKDYEAKHQFEISFITECFKDVTIGTPRSLFHSLVSRCRIAKILDRHFGKCHFISSVDQLQKSLMQSNKFQHAVFDGYFQHPAILFREDTRNKLRDNLLEKKTFLINAIKNNRKCVGIHIRRGDYVSSKAASKVFRTIPIEYYLQALNCFPEKKQVIVFSDDLELASDFSDRIGGINARQLSLSLEDEFCLLMACDDHVIANSTFSWWAAYLGHRPGGRVISPRSWYCDPARSASNPLLLPHFELIDV